MSLIIELRLDALKAGDTCGADALQFVVEEAERRLKEASVESTEKGFDL